MKRSERNSFTNLKIQSSSSSSDKKQLISKIKKPTIIRNRLPSDQLFSNDAIYEIISHHFRDLKFIFKCCALVSKQWLNVVRERSRVHMKITKRLAKTFELQLDHEFWNCVGSVKLHIFNESIVERLSGLSELDIYGIEVRDEGAKLVSQMKQLTKLNIGNNWISHLGTEILSKMPRLTDMDISENVIGLEGVKWIIKMDKLAKLIITLDETKGEEQLEMLSGMKSLKSFSCSCANQIRILKFIGEMKQLTDLKVECKLGSEQFSSITSLENLTCLNLKIYEFGTEGAILLSRMKRLTSISVDYILAEKIEGLGSKAIGEMKQLKKLSIPSNLGIESITSIIQLDNLTDLDLHSNKMDYITANKLYSMKNLTRLNLRNNNIGDKGFKTISKLKRLTSLNVASNNLTVMGAISISKITQLIELNISDNPLRDKGVEEIFKLTQLTKLSINRIGIYSNGIKSINRLKRLTHLEIASNIIGRNGAKFISELKLLRKLDITNNSIKDIGADHIFGMTQLTKLKMVRNAIDCILIPSLFLKIFKLTKLTEFIFDYNDVFSHEAYHALERMKNSQLRKFSCKIDPNTYIQVPYQDPNWWVVFDEENNDSCWNEYKLAEEKEHIENLEEDLSTNLWMNHFRK